MKFFVVALCIVGAFAAPNYQSYGTPEIRVTSYDTPALKTNYEAPIVKVASYDAPAIKVASYDAPKVAYAAPAYAEVKSYAPIEVRKPIIPIVRFNLNDDNYGTFNLDTVSGDGTSVSESGSLRNLGDIEGPVSVMSGTYSFVGDDGKTYTTTWTADENGFRASGEHLPTPPPVPVEHLRVVDSYAAPAVRSMSSYSAPMIKTQTYEAPAIRVVASGY